MRAKRTFHYVCDILHSISVSIMHSFKRQARAAKLKIYEERRMTSSSFLNSMRKEATATIIALAPSLYWRACGQH